MSTSRVETVARFDHIDQQVPYINEGLIGAEPAEVFETLGRLLHEPEVERTYWHNLWRRVESYTARLADRKPTTEPSTYDDAGWQQCYDPSQPTLGIRIEQAFADADMLSMAAQRLRLKGEAVCNIAILPVPAFSQEHITADGELIAASGIMIGADGVVRSGDFPKPIRINAVTSAGNSYLSHQRPAGVLFVNHPDEQQGSSSKSWFHDRLRDTGISRVEPLTDALPATDTRLHQLIHDQMAAGITLAIKPADGSMGRQVVKSDPLSHSPQDIIKRLTSPGYRNSSYIVEPWIGSLPYYQPETDVKADWNIRALVVGKTVVAAYARVAADGEAVNKARGARAVSIEDVLERCGLDPTRRQQVLDNVISTAEQTAQILAGSRYIGVDVIVSPALTSTAIEANGEDSGGLATVAELLSTPGSYRDWSTAEAAVRALHRSLFVTEQSEIHDETGKAVRPAETIATPDDILHGLGFVNCPQLEVSQPIIARALEAIYESLSDSQQQTVHGIWHQAGYSPHIKYRAAMEQTLHKFSNLALEQAEREIITTVANRMQDVMRDNDGRKDISLNLLDLYHDDGAEFYEPLNRYVRADPTDLNRHIGASKLVNELLRVEPARRTGIFLSVESSQGGNAEAMGRAFLLHALAETGTDYRALSYSTFFGLEAHFATIMQCEPPERDYTIGRELTSTDKEWIYLQRVSTHLRAASALLYDKYETLRTMLISGLDPANATDTITAELAAAIQKNIQGHNANLPAAGQMVNFLAMLRLNAFPQACHQLSYLDPDDQPEAYSILEHRIWQLISDQPLTARLTDDPSHPYTHLASRLFQAFDSASNTDVATAWTAYSDLATLLFKEHPQLAHKILPDLDRYISHRTAHVSTHSS